MATEIRRPCVASPARWQQALNRAISEGIQVRQLAGSGAWVATSGSNAGTAYELAVTGTVAHGCSCLAGLNDDPVCKHRAAWYLAAGLLDPEPPTPAAPLVCSGTFSGTQRVVTIVERRHQPGTSDIIDYGHKQRLGAGGSLDVIRHRLHEAGFTPVPVTTAA
jgi:hypothetical protein